MASSSITKFVCDRCGNSLEKDTNVFPQDWQHMVLGQTGARLDLCPSCNYELIIYLGAKEATGMKDACINERELL